MNIYLKSLIFSFLSLICCLQTAAQTATPRSDAYRKICVAFYNVENLFDTIDDIDVRDEEFTPSGLSQWDSKRYYRKLDNISRVISQIGGSAMHISISGIDKASVKRTNGPAIIGLSEVENRRCLQDLINTPALRNNHYAIAHFDSPEARGVDVAFLYNSDILEFEEAFPHRTIVPEQPNFKTRDILRLTGKIDGERFHFMVAHWPSRSGGQKVSEHKRIGAARTMRRISDSLIAADPNCKIIMMGDFNDDPIDKSFKIGLLVKNYPNNLKAEDLFTPMFKMYKDGMGTLAYRDTWNIFDNLVINGNLVGDNDSQYRVMPDARTGNYAYIFKRPFMMQTEGRYKGYPLRTIVGGQYQGGYSDHFPVYLYISRKVKE